MSFPIICCPDTLVYSQKTKNKSGLEMEAVEVFLVMVEYGNKAFLFSFYWKMEIFLSTMAFCTFYCSGRTEVSSFMFPVLWIIFQFFAHIKIQL